MTTLFPCLKLTDARVADGQTEASLTLPGLAGLFLCKSLHVEIGGFQCAVPVSGSWLIARVCRSARKGFID